jgi:hypothetical protein
MPGYWNIKSDLEVKNEITSQLSINSLDFIGRYRKHTNGFTFFDNIRLPNFSPLPKIKSNKDDKLANAKIIVHKEHSKDLKNGSYYYFTCKIIPQSLRIKHNNEFIFTIKNDSKIIEYKPNAKDLIDSIYERFDKADSANNNDISKALNTITYQINKKPETFIYELLQNADDNAGNRDVNVTFYITDKYLLVFHNGEPFTFNNVFAICSVNAEDKSDDIDKIGFKGIGFKSVFKDNDWVFINSGEYSFRFDQSNYSVEKPWQLMPIWTPIDDIELDKMIKNNHKFLSENVSIALRPTNNDIKLLSKYSDTLELFNDDRILLFLKKVKQVHVSLQNKEKIHCRKNNSIWDIRDYTIEVNTEIKTWLNEQIRNNNQEVPIKYQDIGKFKISYAYKVEGGKVIQLVDSTLFNYLPLSISLGFPFLVNSDFIPDGDREELYLNTWNEYLMTEIGRCLPKFISDIVFQKIGSFHLLPDSVQNNFQNSKWNQLYEWFLQGYVESLTGENPIAFIPTKSGSLETLSNVLIDETGLFELLGDEFSKLTGIPEKLIDSNIGEAIEKIKKLISQHNVGVIYDASRLKIDIKTKLQDWLKQPTNNFKFIEHISCNETLKGFLNTEEIVLSNGSDLFKASDIFSEVPEELVFLSPKQVNKEVLLSIKDKGVKIEFKIFEPIQFFKDSILDKTEALNTSLNNEVNLLLFWEFIFKNWDLFDNEKEKEIFNSLRSIQILCKSESTDQLSKCVISKSYLSAEFNLSNEIESTVRSIIEDAHFISEKYILKSGDEIKWRKIFNRLGVIGDLQKTVDDLLPKLSSINEENHFIITKQIFKYWKENKDKETRLTEYQIELIKNNLKLKSIDNIYLETSKCIISDHYQTNKIIDSTLPEVCLINQISSEYSYTQILEWNTFFKEIGCISLDEKQQVLDAKLSFIILKQDDFQEIHFEYIKGIYNLYNSRNTNGLDFDFVNILSQVKLKTTDNEFRSPFNIHLSSIYKPKIDIQSDVDFNESFINFLNKKYFEFKIDKYFLIKMGVNEAFRFHKKDLKRDEIPSEYKTEFENRFNYIVQNAPGYGSQHRLLEHIDLNYKNLLTTYKYSLKFWDEVTKPTPNFVKYLFQKSTYKTAFNSFEFENYILNFLKENPTLPNQSDELNLPSQMYSFTLSEYISDKSVLPKFDFSDLFYNDDKTDSLESILGIKSKLSPKFCIELLSRKENHLSMDEISNLGIVDILLGYKPTVDEIESIYLPNVNQVWKPVSQLFISNDDQLQLDSSQKLHEHLISLAETFGVKELSEDNLILKVSPEAPEFSDDVIFYFKEKAKFIAFKINQLNWEEIESNIVEHLSSFKFSEVDFIAKVFPRDEPIYEQILDFYFDTDRNEIIYNGLWKNNKRVIEFLRNQIQSEKIENVWFDNIINRWNDRKIIETLLDMFGFVPDTWDSDNKEDETESQKDDDSIDPFWSALTDSDIEFIRDIIGGEYELNEQMDSNLAAKIKTLMIIRSDYSQAEISDEGYFLRVGLDEIIVRSAQRGLLFLDLYHWKRLGENNVKLAIHTNNQITFFRTQQDLFDFAKPMNKYGIMKLPISYSLADFNSIGKVSENGKWHFVIIVNENTKTAESYKEVMNLDQYNF